MTEPTDAEIDAVPQEYLLRMFGSRVVFNEAMIDFARAVLAKWGQPTHRGEPVAWLNPWRADQVTTDYDAYGERGIPLYTAPTEQQILEAAFAPAQPAVEASRFGGPELQAMIIARCVEKDLADSVQEDAARLDWLEADESNRVFHLGKSWYTRAGYGSPHLKRASLREAIDAAIAQQKGEQ